MAYYTVNYQLIDDNHAYAKNKHDNGSFEQLSL